MIQDQAWKNPYQGRRYPSDPQKRRLVIDFSSRWKMVLVTAILLQSLHHQMCLQVSAHMTCSRLKWSTFLRECYMGYELFKLYFCLNWHYCTVRARLRAVLCEPSKMFRTIPELASSLSPWRLLKSVQPTVALHATCFAACNGTVGCTIWSERQGDMLDANSGIMQIIFDGSHNTAGSARVQYSSLSFKLCITRKTLGFETSESYKKNT
mgnify:CR=1 FL=1